MTDPSIVVYKYQHSDPLVASWVVWAVFWVLLALIAASLFFLGPLGVVLGVIGVIFVFKKWPRREISLGLRYVICGNTIAYYKNVKRMALRPGHLTLFWGSKDSFKLEEKRFPSNARKAHKITANKAAKFQKVADKLIQRVLAESPHVELVGIERKAAAEVAR